MIKKFTFEFTALLVFLLPVLVFAQSDSTYVDPLGEIAVLLKFNIAHLLLMGGLVAAIVEALKKISTMPMFPTIQGWWILLLGIPLSFLFGMYLYREEGTYTAVIASILIWLISSGGWQMVKGGAKKAGEGFAAIMKNP